MSHSIRVRVGAIRNALEQVINTPRHSVISRLQANALAALVDKSHVQSTPNE